MRGHSNWWHPDDHHQDDGNKDKQGTSIRDEWRDVESVNTQETTLSRDAADIEEAALDEEPTATRGSVRDSESFRDRDTGLLKFRDRWLF